MCLCFFGWFGCVIIVIILYLFLSNVCKIGIEKFGVFINMIFIV